MLIIIKFTIVKTGKIKTVKTGRIIPDFHKIIFKYFIISLNNENILNQLFSKSH